jgi:osmoprotectant transport system permease protein
VIASITGVLASGPVIPDFGKTSSCVKNNGVFCWDWFKGRWHKTFVPALLQHIELSAVAIGIGFAIGFALALAAYRARWLTPPITFVTSLLYTIPSLAAFEILVPVTGINYTTVEIALVSYTLLILFTNTLAGLSGVSPEVRDAATGIGLTPLQSLLRIELPLAVPTIIAGLRVAVVTIISLTTVAAYIVPAGLGKIIFDALNSGDFNTAFIGAGTLCVALALAADGLLAIIQRLLTPWAAARRGG